MSFTRWIRSCATASLVLLGLTADASGVVITAVPAGGPWSLSTTWVPAIQPNLSTGVIIPAGVVVVADAVANVPAITVLGTLMKPAGSLESRTDNLFVGPAGIVTAGASGAPIARGLRDHLPAAGRRSAREPAC